VASTVRPVWLRWRTALRAEVLPVLRFVAVLSRVALPVSRFSAGFPVYCRGCAGADIGIIIAARTGLILSDRRAGSTTNRERCDYLQNAGRFHP
jgi:hypothetical protein